jgi:glycosyltransferase involved in cell wall biosynthesis
LRIAQVAPLFESVPPHGYGGTERVVSYLTEELVREGHDVTLYASGDSQTSAKLISCRPRSLRLDPTCKDPLVHHYLMLERLFENIDDYDLVHFHIDYLHFPLSKRLHRPYVSTLHGRLDLADLVPLYRYYSNQPLVSISNAQRIPLPAANWQGTVYHGLPENLYTFNPAQGKYLAFLGRVSAEKRLDRAIEIAQRVGMPLKVAAKIDPADQCYYQEVLKPILRRAGSLVEFLGEIGGRPKDEFLGNAYALLFPIDWPEPFGLVMIEALACGTPVVAYCKGSVPEVMANGVTGFVVDNQGDAVEAVGRIATIDRRRCRQEFLDRFSAPRMARDYLKIYERITAMKSTRAEQGIAPSRPGGRPPRAAGLARAKVAADAEVLQSIGD